MSAFPSRSDVKAEMGVAGEERFCSFCPLVSAALTLDMWVLFRNYLSCVIECFWMLYC